MTQLSKLFYLIILLFIAGISHAQIPSRVLVGYWHTWDQSIDPPFIPFIKLSDVDPRYNVIHLSFIEAGTTGDVNALALSELHTGSGYSKAQLITDIAAAQTANKVVCFSVGGANGSFRLTSTADKNTFVSKMKLLIAEYGVDGIDIDLEQQSYVCMSGTIQTPTDPHTTNMILALQELLTWYQTTYSKKMVLTMAPETAYVTGGLSPWQPCGGSYLPIIEALENDIDLMMVQLYNSGSQYGLTGTSIAYNEGTVDFLISQTEAVIRGFTAASSKGTFSGLPASKVVIALPSCASAGGGAMSTANVKSAIDYLMGNGSKPGSYTLMQSGGYPTLRGMMTWSINNDNTDCGNTTAGSYMYAANYEDIFGSLATSTTTNQANHHSTLVAMPTVTTDETVIEIRNRAGEQLSLQVMDMQGKVTHKQTFVAATNTEQIKLSLENLPSGIYLLSVFSGTKQESIRIIKE